GGGQRYRRGASPTGGPVGTERHDARHGAGHAAVGRNPDPRAAPVHPLMRPRHTRRRRPLSRLRRPHALHRDRAQSLYRLSPNSRAGARGTAEQSPAAGSGAGEETPAAATTPPPADPSVDLGTEQQAVEVDGLPRAAFNRRADLGGALARLDLLIGVHALHHAGLADGGMFTGEAIEQAVMADLVVAMAVAGLLVQHGAHFGGHGVGGLHAGIVERLGIER